MGAQHKMWPLWPDSQAGIFLHPQRGVTPPVSDRHPMPQYTPTPPWVVLTIAKTD